MQFEKLSAPTLKDLFVRQLQGCILSGELPAGSPLPSERELAAQMQVSRAVVNSGLAMLADQGFLEVLPRQGTRVADYRSRGNLSTLAAIMEYQGGRMGNEEIRSILEVRRALEKLVVERAIRFASDGAVELLGHELEQLSSAASPVEAAEAAFAFEHQLSLISGNTIVPLIYSSFQPAVTTLWIRFCQLYGAEVLYRNASTVYNYLCARDTPGALQWIDRYLGEAISGSQQIYWGS